MEGTLQFIFNKLISSNPNMGFQKVYPNSLKELCLTFSICHTHCVPKLQDSFTQGSIASVSTFLGS